MKRILVFGGCVISFLLGCLPAMAQPSPVRIFEETVGGISEYAVSLQANQTVTFETVNLSSGADPVLHLWDPFVKHEIAFDDNSAGGKAARLTFTAPRNILLVLIVRPRAVWSKGACDINRDGTAWKSGAQLQGWLHPLLNLEANEDIVVVSPPAGPESHRFYILSEDGLHLEYRAGAARWTKWTVPAGFSTFRNFLMGTSPDQGNRKVRLLRNDAKLAGRDPDGDGLGSQLERQLKTCSVKTESFDAFECSTAADLRDTDGDGIPDGWEVLGREWQSPTGSTIYVPLPHFGADPRHKDLFVEVDYRRLTKAENDAAEARHMPAAVARDFARIYGDDETTHPLLRAYHGRLLNNPDLQPGIRVHLDTGLEPETDADSAIYGNWGGYNAIDALRNPSSGNWEGQAPGALWKTKMHPSRYGIFKYGPGHWDGGGQCGAGVACGYNMRDSGNTTHEMGHSFGLSHSGVGQAETIGANCKPNYPSLMNYSYVGQRRFSDGRDRSPLNNANLAEWKAISPSNTQYLSDITNVFRYPVDAQNGHVDWNLDGTIAPTGQTVRAYANNAPGNSCEFTRMNQVELQNAKTNSSLALARFDGKTYLFFVDPSGAVKYATSTSNWQCSSAYEGCAGSSWNEPVPGRLQCASAGRRCEDGYLQRQILPSGCSDRH